MSSGLLEIHWTDVQQIMRCGVQFNFRRTLGPRPPGIAAPIGSGAHAGVELNMRHKKEHAMEPAPRDSVQDIARDTTARLIDDKGVLLQEDEKTIGLDILRGKAIDTAARLSALHYDNLAPEIQPLEIEYPWALNFDSRQAKLGGRIDLIVECGLRDTKTASKAPHKDEAARSDQLTMYAIAYRQLYGDLPKVLTLDKLVLTNADREKPEAQGKVHVLHTARTLSNCHAMLKRIDAAIAVVRSGAFMPAARDSWICSKRFCGYFGECPYVK